MKNVAIRSDHFVSPWPDRLIKSALWLGFLSIVFFFVVFNAGIFSKGWTSLELSFWTTPPEGAGRSGGISTIIVSTLWILGVCLAVSVPVSIGTAILLSEFAPRETRVGRLIGFSLDILAGVPSIVFGLFGNAFFSKLLGFGFSILAGGLTLACMVFPILIRSVEESLRSVSQEYRHAAEALALSKTTLLFKILIPCALPGVFVGLVLGIGRALGETAALIFTSGYVDRMPTSMFDSGRALSVHIYDLSMNVPGGEQNAYRAAFVLLVMIFSINSIVALIAKRWMKRGANV